MRLLLASLLIAIPFLGLIRLVRWRLSLDRQEAADNPSNEVADPDECMSGFEIERPSPIARRGRL